MNYLIFNFFNRLLRQAEEILVMVRHFRFQVLFDNYQDAVNCCVRKNKNDVGYCVLESEFGNSWYVADIDSVKDAGFQYTIWF